MECKHCHKDIPNDAKYCHLCGKRQLTHPKRHRRHRPQSQGSIVKLSGGHRENPYWARMPADYSSGTSVRVSLGCYPTYAAAAEALAKALYTPEREAPKEKTVALQNMYDRFESSHYFDSLSKSAQGSHRSAWKHLSACANIPVSQINKDTFQKSIDDLAAANYRRETLAKVRNLSSLLCKEAMGLGLLTVNYGQLVQLPKGDTTPAKPFDSNHLCLIWDAADNDNKTAMAVLCLIYTGMRPSELLGVDISIHLHIDTEAWYFKTGSKTAAGKNRIIPIPSILHDIIHTLVNNRTAGPLIAAEQGGFWRLDNWRPRRFKPLMEQLDLQNYTVYSCRHTYADLQKRRHVAPEIMMEVMGHSDYSTTVEKYHTTTYEDIARICAAADGFERP